MADEITNHTENLRFEEAWKFVNNHVLPDDHRETVFVPQTKSEINEIRTSILANGRLDTNTARKFSYFTAILPAPVKQSEISNYFDEKMMEFGILLPRPEHLDTIYDKKLGLDIWLQK